MFGLGLPELIVVVVVVLPFYINSKLAVSRGKSVPLMLFLTLIFSYLITLILAFLPKVEET